MNLLFLVTHYRNSGEVRTFVRHLETLLRPGIWIRVYLCDNSGEWDGTEASGLTVTVTRPGRNLGYLGGCAHGWSEFQRVAGDFEPDWIIVSNTDITLEPEFLSVLNSVQAPDPTGVLAPSVRRSDGTDQNPHLWRAPSAGYLRAMLLLLSVPVLHGLYHRLSRPWQRHRRGRASSTPQPVAQPIYAPHGSLMVLHPAFFRRGGTLESDSFMYHEELYIGAQCARLGLPVRYEPALKALHHEGTATSRAGGAQIRAWKNQAIRLVLRDFYAEKA
jgi:GT2 family glycosyltransferase